MNTFLCIILPTTCSISYSRQWVKPDCIVPAHTLIMDRPMAVNSSEKINHWLAQTSSVPWLRLAKISFDHNSGEARGSPETLMQGRLVRGLYRYLLVLVGKIPASTCKSGSIGMQWYVLFSPITIGFKLLDALSEDISLYWWKWIDWDCSMNCCSLHLWWEAIIMVKPLVLSILYVGLW